MRNPVRQWRYSFLVALCAASFGSTAARAEPVITGFNRQSGPIQSVLTIYGSGFGDYQGGSHVRLGGWLVPALAWSPYAIYALIDPFVYGAGPLALDTEYPVQVFTKFDNKASNTRNFKLTSEPLPVVKPPSVAGPPDQPSISSFQKTEFCLGPANVTVYGQGFGQNPAGGYVSVTVPFKDSQGTPFTKEYLMPVLGWTENSIYFLLFPPDGAQPGSYSATVHRANGKTASRSFSVVVCPPK